MKRNMLAKMIAVAAMSVPTSAALANGEPGTTVSMCAGQSLDIGDVNVWNDDTNLYVEFDITTDGWYLEETHVAAGTFPTTKKGNPIPGQLPYSCELLSPHTDLATSCMVTIPLEGLNGPYVDIAAHAAVINVAGDGCGSVTFYATSVEDEDQGLRKNGTLVLPERSIPEEAFEPGIAQTSPGFYSLGFGGSLTVGFSAPVFNGPGHDVCVQEVTIGRGSYPEEKADVLAVEEDTEYLAGTVTNKDNGTGLGCVGLPSSLSTAEAIKVEDMTDSALHNSTADAYDIDSIGACWLYMGDETAWGGACYEGEGTRFVDKGSWGTYFEYEIIEIMTSPE